MPYEFHEIANIMPLMNDEEIETLAQDIKENGLHESIILFEGKILDGRNRYKACERAGVKPHFEHYAGSSAVSFVISLNVKRRHLTASQKAAIAVEAEPFFAAEAKKRQLATQNNKAGKAVKEILPEQEKSQARDQAALAVGGVSGRYVSEAKAIKAESPEKFEQLKTGELSIQDVKEEKKQQAKEQRIQELKNIHRDLPQGIYSVFYADPPWTYSNSGFEMSASQQYPTMDTESICKMDIPKTGENAVLFLWVTNPLLLDGIKVVQAWGFEYKTNIVWIKKRHTAGFYVFGQHELLLIAVKGSMLPDGKKIKSVVEGENKKHSQKPEIFYDIIEKMYPEKKYIELFARNTRKGWSSWGNECD